MDVDSSYNSNPQEISISVKDWDASPPASAAPTITNFNALFYNARSPPRSSTISPPPAPEPVGKRRSHSPESVARSRTERLSSPPPSSPTMRKLERIVSAGVPSRNTKPGLDSLGNPSSKRPRRPVLSAIGPVNIVSQTKSAYPTLEGTDSLFPRRAFSAMLPPNIVDIPSSPLDEESFDPIEASPAQAYMKRQQNKTLRRCDGSDNLRPSPVPRLTPSRQTESPRNLSEPSPRSRWLAPGFGDNEAHGKILPCRRVKEDGLMRIHQRTVRTVSTPLSIPH